MDWVAAALAFCGVAISLWGLFALWFIFRCFAKIEALTAERDELLRELEEARRGPEAFGDGGGVPAMWRGEIDERGRPLNRNNL